MIAFATFFLGIVAGMTNVQVVPGERVAQVELFLDGKSVAELARPPWQAVVDLGPLPEPHLLVAVGKDADGRETGRAEQWINRPKRLAEASLVLDAGSGGVGRTASLSWLSAVAPEPISVRLVFDGKPITAKDLSRIPLPTFVPQQVHFLRAELEFRENVSAVAEIVFGGQQQDQTASDLTAIVVSVPKKAKLPPPEGMNGWFEADGKPLRVVAVEEGPAEVLTVVDSSACAPIEAMASNRSIFGPAVRLRRGQRLRVVGPMPVRRRHSGFDYWLFPESEDLSLTPSDGFLTQFTRLRQSPIRKDDQQLRDALAVAALSASGRDRRRALVLVTGPEPNDRSGISTAGLSHFLKSISVPLYVVSIDAEGRDAAARFGGVPLDGTTIPALREAFWTIADDVERQRVIWVEGKHLPQRIATTSRARDVVRVPVMGGAPPVPPVESREAASEPGSAARSPEAAPEPPGFP